MKEKQYEVLRLLRYVGPREYIEEQLKIRGVKGCRHVPSANAYIQEGFVGEYPEIKIDDTTPKPLINESVREILCSIFQQAAWKIKDDLRCAEEADTIVASIEYCIERILGGVAK